MIGLNNGKGFTLAELLVALAILGEIATFTIPKILSSQQNGRNKAAAMETAATISAAFQEYTRSYGISASMSATSIVPYINYVTRDTTSSIDTDMVTNTTWSCSAAWLNCYKMHNGGTLAISNTTSFGGTATTNNIWFLFDPDGQPSSTKGIVFIIFYNGRLTSTGKASGIYTCNSVNCVTHTGAEDPPWFSW